VRWPRARRPCQKVRLSEGASGAFLFLSGDERFVVKSVTTSERRFLCAQAQGFASYFSSPAGAGSFLTRFYACHALVLPGFVTPHAFVVMGNVMPPARALRIHERYVGSAAAGEADWASDSAQQQQSAQRFLLRALLSQACKLCRRSNTLLISGWHASVLLSRAIVQVRRQGLQQQEPLRPAAQARRAPALPQLRGGVHARAARTRRAAGTLQCLRIR
jgi:hypothetical protein